MAAFHRAAKTVLENDDMSLDGRLPASPRDTWTSPVPAG
jgi:hypothetical protein